MNGDVVVPCSRVADFILPAKELEERYGVRIRSYGHAGDGNLHIYLLKDSMDDALWKERSEKIFDEMYARSDELGGQVSGEHGVGYSRKDYMKSVDLLYGTGTVSVRLPDSAVVLQSAAPEALPDPEAAVRRALEKPVGTPSLKRLLEERRPKTAAITISDITRPVPNRVFLPVLLEELESSGIRREGITVVIGTGMHRPSTEEEKRYLAGPKVYHYYRVIDHRAGDPQELVRVSNDPPVSLNREFMEADFRIVTGFIEPHFMAGFSGGRKGVCPALADLKTIEQFHGYRTLASPRAAAGVLEGNPCHRIALDVARTTGVDFLLNVVLSHDFRVAGVFCGDLEDAHAAGCSFLESFVNVKIREPFDIIIADAGGAPLDLNHYQSVKGMVMALPALKAGGKLVQVSACGEGIGGEAYHSLLCRYCNDWRTFLQDIAASGETKMDQWQIQMLCRVLRHIGTENLYFITDGIPPEDHNCLCCAPPETGGPVEERLQRIVDRLVTEQPTARIAAMPGAPYTVIRA